MTTNKESYTNANHRAAKTHKLSNISKTKLLDYPGNILDISLKPVGKTHTSNVVYKGKKKQLKKLKKHKKIKKAKKDNKIQKKYSKQSK